MITHSLATSFRLCDDEQNDFLLKAYIVLWIIIVLALAIWAIRNFIRADSWEARKKIFIEFIECIPATFILPFPLAGVIIAVLVFLLGEGFRVVLGF